VGCYYTIKMKQWRHWERCIEAYTSLKTHSVQLHSRVVSFVKGFTLIELIVAIAIIAIISVVGVTAYNGLNPKAQDAKRKSDINALAKAYEANFINGTYVLMQDSWFAGGAKPKPVDTDLQGGTDYYNDRTADGSAFRVCATLVGGTPMCSDNQTPNCFCIDSSLGRYIAGTNPPPPNPNPPPGPNPPPPNQPPVAQVTFRTSASTTAAAAAGSGGTYTSVINKPSAIQQNDVMIIQVVTFNNQPSNITPPTGWNLIGSRMTSGPNLTSAIYSKTAASGETGPYTFTLTAAAAPVTSLSLAAYYNAASPIFPTYAAYGLPAQASTITTNTGVTTVAANEMLIFFGVAAASNATLGVPAGMNQNIGSVGSVIVSAEQLISTSGSIGAKTANITASPGGGPVNGYGIAHIVSLRPLEAVSETNFTGCGNGCTDHFLNVDCKGIPTRHAQVRETNHAGTRRGTIVYSTGLFGNSLYSTTPVPTNPFPWTETPHNNPQITVSNMNAAGFKGYEIYWTDPNGWGTNASGYGFKNAMCGYASIVNWIDAIENSSSNVMCAQGNSAGGAQIAYGLSYYNLASKIDMAIISGGPPFSNIEKQCESNSPYTDGSTAVGSAGRDTFIDYMLGWQDPGEHYCMNVFSAGVPSALIKATAQANGIASTNLPGSYSYPNTKINFIQTQNGADDLVQYQGNYYMNLVNTSNGLKSNYTTSGYPSGYGHLVDQYNSGVNQIRNLLNNECKTWP
jgi:prepilin-type N-terminal cleavage/methylation domain-containing protein